MARMVRLFVRVHLMNQNAHPASREDVRATFLTHPVFGRELAAARPAISILNTP
jgi:hypothetical protein